MVKKVYDEHNIERQRIGKAILKVDKTLENWIKKDRCRRGHTNTALKQKVLSKLLRVQSLEFYKHII